MAHLAKFIASNTAPFPANDNYRLRLIVNNPCPLTSVPSALAGHTVAPALNPDSTSITYGYPYEVTSNPLTRTVTDAAGNVATTTMDSGMRPITVKTEDSGFHHGPPPQRHV